MNRIVTIYDVASGRVLQHVSVPAQKKLPTLAEGMALVEGYHVNPNTHRVVDGVAAALDAKDLAEIYDESARQLALATIRDLEFSQQRSIRELLLNPENDVAREKLSEVDAEISAHRAKLKPSADIGPAIIQDAKSGVVGN